MRKVVSEKSIIALISAVQFINIVDFMMVMPLGPDFAQGLGISASKLGLIGGSYTAAGAVAGVTGSFFLDRFDRRKALFICMLGLAVGTILGGFATSLLTLMCARVVAGIFGGPATSLSLSIVADVVAPERRGRAMGAVMGAFSLASIAGVPLALELARFGGWRMPFFAVGGTAILICLFSMSLLPPMRDHLVRIKPISVPVPLLKRFEVIGMYASVALGMFGSFLMVPNLSTYFQFNRGYPRDKLSLLYFVGGILSFFAMRFAGRAIDRLGVFGVALASGILITADLIFGFIRVSEWIPTIVIFVAYMLAMSVRGVVISTLASRVPKPNERARYMSFQSAVQHVFCALGAFASTQFLRERPDGGLDGMDKLALVTIAVSLLVPFVLRLVETRVERNETLEKTESFALG